MSNLPSSGRKLLLAKVLSNYSSLRDKLVWSVSEEGEEPYYQCWKWCIVKRNPEVWSSWRCRGKDGCLPADFASCSLLFFRQDFLSPMVGVVRKAEVLCLRLMSVWTQIPQTVRRLTPKGPRVYDGNRWSSHLAALLECSMVVTAHYPSISTYLVKFSLCKMDEISFRCLSDVRTRSINIGSNWHLIHTTFRLVLITFIFCYWLVINLK